MDKHLVSEASEQEQSYLIAGLHWLQNHGQCLLINMIPQVYTLSQLPLLGKECDIMEVWCPSLADSGSLRSPL